MWVLFSPLFPASRSRICYALKSFIYCYHVCIHIQVIYMFIHSQRFIYIYILPDHTHTFFIFSGHAMFLYLHIMQMFLHSLAIYIPIPSDHVYVNTLSGYTYSYTFRSGICFYTLGSDCDHVPSFQV